MSFLFMDGFDHYTGSPAGGSKWGSVLSSVNIGSTSPRTGIGYMSINSNGSTCTTKTFTPSGGFVVGMAFRMGDFAAGSVDLIRICEGATVHLAFGLNASRIPVVKLNTTVIQTGSTVYALNSWYYIEVKGTIHDTTGSYTYRIDGVNQLTASGVDTRNGATGVWDNVVVASSGGFHAIDDFYLLDSSGSAPWNDFLGSIKVETLFPQTDAVAAGSNAGLTPSTGTDHGALVDETTPNTTDYNSHATVGQKDTYNFPTMTLAGTIYAIQTNMYVSKSDATVRQVCAVVRAGGVDYDGANVSPLTTFQNFNEIRTLNPNTGIAWVVADITTLQAGMKVTV